MYPVIVIYQGVGHEQPICLEGKIPDKGELAEMGSVKDVSGSFYKRKLQPISGVFMIDIEKYYGIVSDFMAEATLVRQFFPLFAALLAPVIDKAVVAAADVFFESAVVNAVHPAVGIGRVVQ